MQTNHFKTVAVTLGVGLLVSACQMPGQTALEAQGPAGKVKLASPAAPVAVETPPRGTSAGIEMPAPAATPPASAGEAAAGVQTPTAAPASEPTQEGDTKPFAFDAPERASQPQPASCEFPALKGKTNYKLFAAGAYSGRRLDFGIDDSGNEAGRYDVAVNHTAAPVVLMLGSYDPTVWHVGWTKGTRIAAVLVSGYHRQVITGLPAGVPVINSTYDNRGACGYFYVSAERANTLNPVARRAFGRAVDMVYLAEKGRVVVGNAVDGVPLITDASARDDSAFRIGADRAGGKEGLDYAVSQGWLRKAQPADAEAWLAAQARIEQADVPPIAGGRPAGHVSMHNAYVVLKPFKFPPGLYGGHLATFFLPKGVSKPTGDMGHSTLYDFNTLKCSGTLCDRD